MKFIVSLLLTIFCQILHAEILGQMSTMGQVYVITSEVCKLADGNEARNWSLSYSYNAIGMATRSCYQKYNNNIWIWEFTGREYIFPAEYFKLSKS